MSNIISSYYNSVDIILNWKKKLKWDIIIKKKKSPGTHSVI